MSNKVAQLISEKDRILDDLRMRLQAAELVVTANREAITTAHDKYVAARDTATYCIEQGQAEAKVLKYAIAAIEKMEEK